MKNKISRKFYYYNINAQHLDNTTNRLVSYPNQREVLLNTFSKIKELEYKNGIFTRDFLGYKDKNNSIIFIEVDETTKDFIKFRLILTQNNFYPYVEEARKLKPLKAYLPKENQYLAEISHGVIFLCTNTLALEYNRSGAKKRELRDYIIEKSDQIEDIPIINLINMETLKKIKENGELSLFEIKVNTNSSIIAELAKMDTAFASLNCKKQNLDTIEVILKRRITKNKRGFFIENFNSNIISKLFKNHKEDIETCRIKYETGSEEIDLLSNKFVCSQKFVSLDNMKTIYKEDAYKTMIQYYNNQVKTLVEKD